jgi:hypothetical protein
MLVLRRQKVWAKTQQCWCTCRAADTRAAARKNKRHFAPAPAARSLSPPANGHALPPALAAHPARPGARRSTALQALRGLGGCWTCASGWGRVAPRGCPGATASGRATWKGRGASSTARLICCCVPKEAPTNRWSYQKTFSFFEASPLCQRRPPAAWPLTRVSRRSTRNYMRSESFRRTGGYCWSTCFHANTAMVAASDSPDFYAFYNRVCKTQFPTLWGWPTVSGRLFLVA